MIKVYASIASVGFLVLATGAACSSANTPDDEGDGGTSSAGTNSNAGTTVVPTAGTTSDGGTGNASAGTGNASAGTGNASAGTSAAGTGSGGTPPVAGAACKSIKTGEACAPEGQDCPMLACGLADSGVRDCLCQGTWMCQSCDFTNSPFKDKPATVETCTNQADKLDCTGQEGVVCEGAAGGEVCACWPDDEGALIWDCDKAPTSWAVPAAM